VITAASTHFTRLAPPWGSRSGTTADLAPISITFFTQRLVVEGGGAIPTEVPGSASTSTGMPPER
jgi:hypothetical protein